MVFLHFFLDFFAAQPKTLPAGDRFRPFMVDTGLLRKDEVGRCGFGECWMARGLWLKKKKTSILYKHYKPPFFSMKSHDFHT